MIFICIMVVNQVAENLKISFAGKEKAMYTSSDASLWIPQVTKILRFGIFIQMTMMRQPARESFLWARPCPGWPAAGWKLPLAGGATSVHSTHASIHSALAGIHSSHASIHSSTAE